MTINGDRISKIKRLLEKGKTLQKIVDNPEKNVAKAGVLNSKNLYKLLAFLRDIYPIGYSFEGIEKKMNLTILLRRQIDELVIEGLLKKRDFSEEDRKKFNPNFIKFFPEYVITNKGMEFVNNLEVHNLNKSIKLLTQILIGFGIISLILTFIQIYIQIYG